MASREAVGAFVADRTDKAGRVSGSALKNFARLANLDREPYMKALEVRLAGFGISKHQGLGLYPVARSGGVFQKVPAIALTVL